MKVFHAGQKQLIDVKPGDIVRALGRTKSVTLGRVVSVGVGIDVLTVAWFGVGEGSGWLASDVEVVQTKEERAEYEALQHRLSTVGGFK